MPAAIKFTEEQIEFICNSYLNGMSSPAIAKIVGVVKQTIIKVLKNNDVPIASTSELKLAKYAIPAEPIEVDTSVKNDFYVYFHRSVSTGEIFYIGKGRGNRAYVKYGRSSRWKDFVALNDYFVEIHLDSLSETEAGLLEKKCIQNTKNLTNISINSRVQELDVEFCTRYFRYSTESPSCLLWVEGSTLRKRKSLYAGYKRRGREGATQVWTVCLNNAGFSCHRIIWILKYGVIPENYVVDHIDGNSLNNCISNLRVITAAKNARNRKKHSNNTSGVVGVHRFKRYDLSGYTADVMINDKRLFKHFYFHKLSEPEAFRLACEWRTERIKELNEQGAGYTERHGK